MDLTIISSRKSTQQKIRDQTIYKTGEQVGFVKNQQKSIICNVKARLKTYSLTEMKSQFSKLMQNASRRMFTFEAWGCKRCASAFEII